MTKSLSSTASNSSLQYFGPAALDLLDRWNLIVDLLSMDVVVPFYRSMGLGFLDSIAFRDLVRQLIVDGRKEFPTTDPALIVTRREHLCDRITFAFSAQTCSDLQVWGDKIFRSQSDEPNSLDHWTLVLHQATLTGGAWNALQVPSSLYDEFRNRFLSSIDMTEYEKQRTEMANRPLSDWDLHLFALRQFDDDIQLSNHRPSSYIRKAITAYEGMRFWRWVLRNLADKDLNRLQQNALEFCQSEKTLAAFRLLPFPNPKGVAE